VLQRLVESPQLICNPSATLNQKQLFLQKAMEDEVAAWHSLLQKQREIKRKV